MPSTTIFLFVRFLPQLQQFLRMVDAKEKDKAPDATEKDEAPPNLLNDIEEEEDDDDEDEYEYDDDNDDEEEDEEEYDDEEPEQEEEKVNDEENAAKEDGKKGEEPKTDKNLDESSQSKVNRRRSRNTKKKVENDSGTLAANGDKDKPESSNRKKAANGDNNKRESSNKKKGSKRVECMGMVFMCSSKTKADCFRYKVLGLPENKKDQVLKIYKGMRLFLFDVDLRLMYGIFKAAGPGGYNIEPKAFKSEFPSQVRFTVLDDCLPLAEENFKSVLKENYYSRRKFEGLLQSEQVKKLCKLFEKMGDGRRSRSRRARPVEPRRSRLDESRRDRLDDRRTSRAQEKRKRARDEERRPRSPPPREKRRYPDYDRRSPVLYDREPPVPRYHRLPEPSAIRSPVRLYTYERQPLDIPPYVRDHVPEPPTYRVVERDQDRDRDPYLAYGREPPPLYRDTVYTTTTTVPPEYHLVSREYPYPSAVQAPEYRISGASRVPSYRDVEIAGDYRSAAALPLPDYRSRTHYRYPL
uniref:Putative development/cell death domain-containing protein n=1 Tax=Helianthus annuus TaxID=4232 RepID=A0A251RUF5_HELAN